MVPAGHFHFERIPISNEITHTFYWTNFLQEPAVVTAARLSCDCLEIVERPDRIEPNTTVQLRLLARPSDAGSVYYAAFLELTNPPVALMFTLSGTVESPADRAQATGRAASILIEPAELRDRLSGPNRPRILDVRPQARFVLGHLPDSLNVPFHQLRGNLALRRGEIALVDEGHDSRGLCEQVSQLPGSGSLRVLNGGLRAWQRSGGGLAGLSPHSSLLFEFPADDMLRRLGDPRWRWVLVYDDAPPLLEYQSSGIEPVRYSDLGRLLAADSAEASTSVQWLILDRDGGGYERYEPLAQAATSHSVFYLAGGWDGFRAAALRWAANPRQVAISTSAAAERGNGRADQARPAGGGCCGGRR
jgi:rhodanese-related sulfurtransferase